MATERNVVDFKIHNLTEEQFQELKAQGKIDPNAVYCTPDESLKRNQITNCITEIPQNIKLVRDGGTITIKAGSVVHRAYGNLDTTYTFTSDSSLTPTYNGQYYVIPYGSAMFLARTDGTSSGAIANRPTSISVGSAAYFATDENKIYVTSNSGATWTDASSLSLPIAVITVKNGALSSIDQVFNGFGYIGSHAFISPDVKGLVSNGYNDDGTLRNDNLTMTKPVVSLVYSGVLACGLYNGFGSRPNYYIVDTYEDMVEKNLGGFYYIKETNACYSWAGGSGEKYPGFIPCGTVRVSGGKVQSIDINRPFRAVDYNDFEELDNSAVHKTGNETIGGEKTFTSTIRIQGQYLHFDGIDSTAAQSFKDIDAYDKNGAAIGGFRIEHSSTNGRSVSLITRKSDGSVGGNLGVRTKPDGTYSSFAPTPASTSNSTEIATTKWVNDAVVHKTGDETINGTKKFTGNIIYKKEIDQSVLPTSSQYYTWSSVQDKNGKYLSYIETTQFNTGDVAQAFGARREDSNGTKHTASITVKVNADFTKSYRLSDSPTSASNGTDIATTAWVRDLFEALYPVGSLYITSTNTTTCPLASIVKKSDGSNSTWALVSSGKALWTGTGSNGNTTIAAGLPNITANFIQGNYGYQSQATIDQYISGAVNYTYKEGGKGLYAGGEGGGAQATAMQATFNASRSSSIYGQSSTVQPPAYVVNVWRRTA